VKEERGQFVIPSPPSFPIRMFQFTSSAIWMGSELLIGI